MNDISDKKESLAEVINKNWVARLFSYSIAIVLFLYGLINLFLAIKFYSLIYGIYTMLLMATAYVLFLKRRSAVYWALACALFAAIVVAFR